MVLELHAEGLRDDVLVAEVQQVRALEQHVGQHEDHERVAALFHRLAHDGQELVLALHHAVGVDAGDLADTEIVVGDVEILEIREQQHIGRLVVGDGCGKPQPKTKRSLCRRSALRHSGFLQLTALIMEQSGVLCYIL